jgi:hypothetical protein
MRAQPTLCHLPGKPRHQRNKKIPNFVIFSKEAAGSCRYMGVGFIWFLGGHRLTAIRRGATAALPRVLERQRWRRVFGFSCCRREAKGGGGFFGFSRRRQLFKPRTPTGGTAAANKRILPYFRRSSENAFLWSKPIAKWAGYRLSHARL